jgi:hypothetical protein
MATNTFGGVVRSYGGRSRRDGVIPGGFLHTVLVSGAANATAGTADAQARLGSLTTEVLFQAADDSTNPLFVLPKGAIPVWFSIITGTAAGTSPLIQIGTNADPNGFKASKDPNNENLMDMMDGALIVATGLTADFQVEIAKLSGTVPAETVQMLFAYYVYDAGLPGERQ